MLFHRLKNIDPEKNKMMGFTLIELMVVGTIVGILSITLIVNFREMTTRTALDKTTAKFVSDLRDAQARAIAAKPFQGQLRCGYGIHKDSSENNVYYLYTGPPSATVDCSSEKRGFKVSEGDENVVEYNLDPGLAFRINGQNFPDIFFEPPDPKTYICNNDGGCSSGNCAPVCSDPNIDSLDGQPFLIYYDPECSNPNNVNQCNACGEYCRVVSVYRTGRIEVE